MKNLIILIMSMIGCAGLALAQSEVKAQSTDEIVTESVNLDSANYSFEAPMLPEREAGNSSVFPRLNHLLGYREKPGEVIYMGGFDLYKEVPRSKFQLIVDERGNVVDCTLLEASTDNNTGKDKIVRNFLLTNRIFDGPGLLNGEPCKSVVILTVGYSGSGRCNMSSTAYPILNLPAAENSAPNDSSAAK